jgi:hypothetical protein
VVTTKKVCIGTQHFLKYPLNDCVYNYGLWEMNIVSLKYVIQLSKNLFKLFIFPQNIKIYSAYIYNTVREMSLEVQYSTWYGDEEEEAEKMN